MDEEGEKSSPQDLDRGVSVTVMAGAIEGEGGFRTQREAARGMEG